MKRLKVLKKDDIIQLAKHLEFGDTIFKVNDGSIKEALIEARYYLEHGMSKEQYRDQRYIDADEFFSALCEIK